MFYIAIAIVQKLLFTQFEHVLYIHSIVGWSADNDVVFEVESNQSCVLEFCIAWVSYVFLVIVLGDMTVRFLFHHNQINAIEVIINITCIESSRIPNDFLVHITSVSPGQSIDFKVSCLIPKTIYCSETKKGQHIYSCSICTLK